MRERFKRYRTHKEVALDKIGKRDAMAKIEPKKNASEWFKRPPYGSNKEEDKNE